MNFYLNINKLFIIFIILLYPLFVRYNFNSLNFNFLLNILFLFFSFLILKNQNLKLNNGVYFVTLFTCWMLFVLFNSIYNGFQISNFDTYKDPLFAINEMAETAENYYSIGDYSHNIKYMLRMIIFIPLGYFVGSSIKNVNPNFIIKFFWFFLIIAFVKLIIDFYNEGFERLSGIYNNPQDMSAILLFNLAVVLSISKIKFSIIIYILITSISIYLTGTRSSLIVLILMLFLKNRTKIFLIISVFSLVFVSYVLPNLIDFLYGVEFTSISSSVVRLRLWVDYLWPHIFEKFFVGNGTIPVVTENLLLFLLYVYGFVGTCIFLTFLLLHEKNKNYGSKLLVSVFILQSTYFMGLLSLDNIVITFFWFGYLSQKYRYYA